VEEPLEEGFDDDFTEQPKFSLNSDEFLSQYFKDKEEDAAIETQDMPDIQNNDLDFDDGKDVNISDFNPDSSYVKPEFDDELSPEILQQQKIKEKERQERLRRKEEFAKAWKKDYGKEYNDKWWTENEPVERDAERQRAYNQKQRENRNRWNRENYKPKKIHDSVEDMINLIIEERFSNLKKK
jgi:hypothetical protein